MSTTTSLDFALRRATTADLGALDALYARGITAQAKADYAPSAMVTALPLVARAQPRLVAMGSARVAQDPRTGELLGAAGWSWSGPHGGPSPMHMAHLRQFVTDPGRLRQGIGAALVGAVLDEARTLGARLMDCHVLLGAVPFLTALGFRQIGPVTLELKQGVALEAMRMQRRL